MKARIKETGELVEVHTCDDADFQDRQGRFYWEHQLYFGTLDDFDKDVPDYWEKLKHQAAISAMQGIMANSLFVPYDGKEIADLSNDIATALVEKLRGE